jgi:probable F420-dependent oxidoreductase
MVLGRIGAWLGELALRPAVEERTIVRELEEVGYGAVWFGETPFNREALSHAALLLGWTERIAVATGIASIWLREPAAAANGAAALAEAHPGRFVLGLGVSHAPIVASLGDEYARPLTRMRAYLDAMDAVTYRAAPPAEPAPRVLAALAPRMLELARDRADGAHPYLVTPAHTAEARKALGPGKLLAPEQAFTLERDAAAAREAGRRHLRIYLGLENYRRSWLRQGFSEADFEDGGSDALVDALVAWGGEDAVRARIDEHLTAGADHVAVQAVGSDPVGELRRLAVALGLEPPGR